MGARSAPLSPPEIAGLTRLALSFCLGRGSLCTVTRSISLQLYQPRLAEDYIWYQWRRLSIFLPSVRPPKLHEAVTGHHLAPEEKTEKPAQWRLRVSSIHLQVAQRLLYPQPGSSRAFVTMDMLGLVGVEAMACLWADRGRLVQPRGNPHAQGRLNLSRYDWNSAATIQQWIHSLTSADSRLAGNPRNNASPMLFFDHQAVVRLLGNMGDTWMAQAACLAPKFQLKAAQEWSEQMVRERLAVYGPLPTPPMDELVEEATGVVPKLKVKTVNRRVPQPPPEALVPSTQDEVA